MRHIKPLAFDAFEDETKETKIGSKMDRKYRFKLELTMTYSAQKNFDSGNILGEAWPLSYLHKIAF